ncbi:speriolin-like protein [Oncorhynchus keta]|uniref:speriolin-like protein n=1 Tax=Oncorhynchus keta TaxID=8018 RepID=UPI00227AFAE5|nr:speriolin-like protein [Oncorhynchus keta]
MDTEGGGASLRLENEKLRYENDHLKIMLDLMKENFNLKSKLQTSALTSDTLRKSTGRNTTIQWQDIVDEDRFKHELHQSPRHPHRTSSPVNLESYTKSCMGTDPREHEETASCSYVMSQKVKDPERLLGEIAFQLDRRILSYVFQGQNRLYGFTVLNIRDKIIQVSTHPLTGRWTRATGSSCPSYTELMAKLKQLGYSMTLHPPFTEFIINTYGILKQRADSYSARELGYNSPDFLRRVVINSAPSKLLKDLLLLFSCLSFMARQDGKPLFLW